MNSILKSLSPNKFEELKKDLGKMLIYHISHSFATAESFPEPERILVLKEFISNPELDIPSGTFIKVVSGIPLYKEIGVLTENECGSFWEKLMRSWEEDSITVYPEKAERFFMSLQAYTHGSTIT